MDTQAEKPKRGRRPKDPGTSTRLSEAHLATLDQIFPGFAAWYCSTRDEQGNPLPLPGLGSLREHHEA